jgi:hypothetical protein
MKIKKARRSQAATVFPKLDFFLRFVTTLERQEDRSLSKKRELDLSYRSSLGEERDELPSD